MAKLDTVEKATEAYRSGKKVEAFAALLDLARNGDALAQYRAAMVCQENMLLYMASDLWNDLLNYQVEPRDVVAKEEYEILMWVGDIKAARKFISTEKMTHLQADLESRDYVQDSSNATKIVGSNAMSLLKLESQRDFDNDFEAGLKALELRCNIATIASQLMLAGKKLDTEGALLLSGEKLWTQDLQDLTNDPLLSWSEVRRIAAHLLGDMSLKPSTPGRLVESIALLGQQAQERIFFLQGNMQVSDEEDKSYLQNIALGIQTRNPVASEFYLKLVF